MMALINSLNLSMDFPMGFHGQQSMAIGLLFAVTATLAQAVPLNERPIYVQGNERTRPAYIEHLVRNCLEDTDETPRDDDAAAQIIRACLLNSRLFVETAVHVAPDRIDVTVEDRWTLIPIPFASAGSGDDRAAGVFLLETNFLGIGQMLALGGAITNAGSSYFGFYRDPSVAFSPWSLGLNVMRSSVDLHSYAGKEAVAGFSEVKVGFGASLGYRFSGRLSADVNLRRTIAGYRTLDTYTEDPTDNAGIDVGLKAKIGEPTYRFYFQEGFELQPEVWAQVARSGPDKRTLSAAYRANYATAVHGDHALKVSASSGISRGGGVADTFRLGGHEGTRGIPANGAWVESYHAVSVDYLMPVRSGDTGILASGVFADGGYLRFREPGRPPGGYSAAGISVYYFLKKVAVPGFGLEIGYNPTFQGAFGTASVGLGFN